MHVLAILLIAPLMLVLVVFFFEKWVKRGQTKASVTAEATTTTKPTKRKLPIPWYVLAFLIICVANSFLPLPSFLNEAAHFISTWFETTALAAIGLRLDFKRFIEEGPKFLIYGTGVGLVQTVAAVSLIFLLHL